MEEYRNRGKLAAENEEFQEEEVWGGNNNNNNNQREPKSSSGRRLPVARRWRAAEQSSVAPVSIPDYWSKIYCGSKSKSMKGDNDEEGEGNVVLGCGDYDQDYDDDDGVVPPHEYIARRLARTKIASFSMCEGVGRTLKGRDLSKVRNAILTKTGFLEE